MQLGNLLTKYFSEIKNKAGEESQLGLSESPDDSAPVSLSLPNDPVDSNERQEPEIQTPELAQPNELGKKGWFDGI